MLSYDGIWWTSYKTSMKKCTDYWCCFFYLSSSGTPWRNWRDCDDWRNTGRRRWCWGGHIQVWPRGSSGGDRSWLSHPQVHRDVTHGWAQATVQKPEEQASVILHVHRLFGRWKLLRLEIRPPQRSTRGAISRIRSRPGSHQQLWRWVNLFNCSS